MNLHTTAQSKAPVVVRGKVLAISSKVFVYSSSRPMTFTEVRCILEGIPVVSRARYTLDAQEGDDLVILGYWRGEEVWISLWWNNTKGRGYEPKTWFFWPSLVSAVVFMMLFVYLFYRTTLFVYSLASLSIPVLVGLSLAAAYSARRSRRDLRLIQSHKVYLSRI